MGLGGEKDWMRMFRLSSFSMIRACWKRWRRMMSLKTISINKGKGNVKNWEEYEKIYTLFFFFLGIIL